MQNRDFFIQAGGQEFHYIPALNTQETHIEMFARLVERHTAGWPDTFSPDQQSAEAQALRAREKGAKS